jgi:hypothetical protein
MANDAEHRFSPAEVEIILRRAAELNGRFRRADASDRSVSPAVLVQVAAAAGIPEATVRRAMRELDSERATESSTLSGRLYGHARLRVVREIERPPEDARERLESLLRLQQGLKLRQKTPASSVWDPGDALGAVRRTLDLSGKRSLLKTHSVELRVEGEDGHCGANLTADISNQRGEYFSLGGILGATLAVPLAIAGVQNGWFFLAVLPALIAPSLGFKLAYDRACAEIRRSLDELLDAAEDGEQREQDLPAEEARNLDPAPRGFREKGE